MTRMKPVAASMEHDPAPAAPVPSHCGRPLVERVGTRNDGTARYRCHACREVVSIPPAAPAAE